jgi:hypothetical protein
MRGDPGDGTLILRVGLRAPGGGTEIGENGGPLPSRRTLPRHPLPL